jgi:hypothetical protein
MYLKASVPGLIGQKLFRRQQPRVTLATPLRAGDRKRLERHFLQRNMANVSLAQALEKLLDVFIVQD